MADVRDGLVAQYSKHALEGVVTKVPGGIEYISRGDERKRVIPSPGDNNLNSVMKSDAPAFIINKGSNGNALVIDRSGEEGDVTGTVKGNNNSIELRQSRPYSDSFNSISIEGRGNRLLTYDGPDVVSIEGANHKVTLGSGDDVIQLDLSKETKDVKIDGGAGRDVLKINNTNLGGRVKLQFSKEAGALTIRDQSGGVIATLSNVETIRVMQSYYSDKTVVTFDVSKISEVLNKGGITIESDTSLGSAPRMPTKVKQGEKEIPIDQISAR